MKAVRIHEQGKYDVLKLRACALNHLDLWLRQGAPGRKVPLPHILGSDIAGEVARAGNLVTKVKPGDRVIVLPGASCGECRLCLSGQDNRCPRFHIIGSEVDGGYAEYVKVPGVNVAPMPDGLSFEEAAAFPLATLTAWHMLVTRAGVRAGEDVLVLAAGSGIGTQAVQIAKHHGARVIAAAGSDEKLKKARELGADETINYTRQDLAEEARRLTGGRGVDVVFEHVGQATWEKSVQSLATGGRLVTCGATTGAQVQLNLAAFYVRQLTFLGSRMGSKGEMLHLIRLLGERRLRSVIDRVMPLKEAATAHELLDQRAQFGKIVLVP
ncbi:MAG: zinc-binding dehydrogenase [Deltaproteobacteria bacterium]|nr:zinc-binding dehydrogenase [Deltaproteobacteria bacterium]